jgi:hypothetical protein
LSSLNLSGCDGPTVAAATFTGIVVGNLGLIALNRSGGLRGLFGNSNPAFISYAQSRLGAAEPRPSLRMKSGPSGCASAPSGVAPVDVVN